MGGENLLAMTKPELQFLESNEELPHNLDAERSLLGSILIDSGSLGLVSEILEPGDFHSPAHEIIFAALKILEEGGEAVDSIVLGEHLRREGRLAQAGGEDYLDGLPQDASSLSLVEVHARLVRDKAMLRKLIRTGREVTRLGLEGRGEVGGLVDRAEEAVSSLGQSLHGGDSRAVGDILHQVYERIEVLRNKEDRLTGLSSGFQDLDDLTAGLHPGELLIVAGRPSMGKTSFANNLVDRISMTGKVPAAIFSLEVAAEQVVQNLLCIHSRVDAQRVRKGIISNQEMDRLRRSADSLYDAPIYVDDSQGLTSLGIRHKARRLAKSRGIKLVVVDYMQLMESDAPGRSESRQQEISKISRGLKSLARELDVPVVALSQLNRSVEQRDDHRPRMSDLRESGSIEQDADVVMLLHREEYFKKTDHNEGIAEVIIAKQRNGPTGTMRLHFQKECMRFDSLASGNVSETLA